MAPRPPVRTISRRIAALAPKFGSTASLAWNRSARRVMMSKETFLTVRWNNVLSLALGLPALIYVVYAFSSGMWQEKGWLIGLAIIGVLY
jgi:hypothetical protein